MVTKIKSKGNDLNGLKVKTFNDGDFLSEGLMRKMVQREMARVVRTSENLCIIAVCFENLLINSTTKDGSDNQIKLFIKSVEKLKRNIRETDLFGWIKKDNTFGIVFTVEKTVSKEIIESRINKIFNISLNNTKCINIDIDVTMWSAERDGKSSDDVENAVLNYFKKKNQFMNQE